MTDKMSIYTATAVWEHAVHVQQIIFDGHIAASSLGEAMDVADSRIDEFRKKMDDSWVQIVYRVEKRET